jgi:hypothetical protein
LAVFDALHPVIDPDRAGALDETRLPDVARVRGLTARVDWQPPSHAFPEPSNPHEFHLALFSPAGICDIGNE